MGRGDRIVNWPFQLNREVKGGRRDEDNRVPLPLQNKRDAPLKRQTGRCTQTCSRALLTQPQTKRMRQLIMWPAANRVNGLQPRYRLRIVKKILSWLHSIGLCQDLRHEVLPDKQFPHISFHCCRGSVERQVLFFHFNKGMKLNQHFTSPISLLYCNLPRRAHAFSGDCPVLGPCCRWQGDSIRVCKLVLLSAGQREPWRPHNMTQENVC